MRKYLFLYLALACFIVIVTIFIFDGYIGVYDSATIKTGEFTQEITADAWPRGNFSYSISSQSDQKVFFTYKIANRTFGTYRKTVSASLWQQNRKIQDLYSQSLEIRPFQPASAAWQVDPIGLNLGASPTEQFTVRIERDKMVREIVISFFTPTTGPGIPKPIPVLPPVR